MMRMLIVNTVLSLRNWAFHIYWLYPFTCYPYLKWHWIFSFLRRLFLFFITTKTFTWLYYIYE